jgi:hypothetical protein
MRRMRIELQRVHYMPKELQPGILYVSEEFGAAAHLCACGCGTKVRTPLGPTEWSLEDTPNGPSLEPSVGNWQHPCQSHYWILDGTVRWDRKWTPEEIDAGRRREQSRRHDYYSNLKTERTAPSRLWLKIKSLIGW